MAGSGSTPRVLYFIVGSNTSPFHSSSHPQALPCNIPGRNTRATRLFGRRATLVAGRHFHRKRHHEFARGTSHFRSFILRTANLSGKLQTMQSGAVLGTRLAFMFVDPNAAGTSASIPRGSVPWCVWD
jgi:hypothetical protein